MQESKYITEYVIPDMIFPESILLMTKTMRTLLLIKNIRYLNKDKNIRIFDFLDFLKPENLSNMKWLKPIHSF